MPPDEDNSRLEDELTALDDEQNEDAELEKPEGADEL